MSPKLSIITVVYNGEELLEGTIRSILEQSYPHIEYLLVDGASTDGTWNIVEKYKDQIYYCISEPDKGIYDAMNKGLARATGDYVWFMNCGDWIYAPDTVERMFASAQQADVYYGECMVVDSHRREIGLRSQVTPHQVPQNLNWKSLERGMVVSHQSFVPRRSIAPAYIMGNLAADIDWVIRCLKKSHKAQYTGLVLSQFLEGGVSTQRRQQGWKDRYRILSEHYGPIRNALNHTRIAARHLCRKLQG